MVLAALTASELRGKKEGHCAWKGEDGTVEVTDADAGAELRVCRLLNIR